MELIFSDIHADIDALNLILRVVSTDDFEKKYGAFSRIINLGDIIERGTHPKETLQKLDSLSKNYVIESVIGNHDEAFLYNRKISENSLESKYAHSLLTKEDLAFFRKNTDGTYGQQEFLDKKNSVLYVHGGPLDPKKITPIGASEESWLYQKSWQRLSEINYSFFDYAGYNYDALSAFTEVKNILSNFVIFCGHQHIEAALKQDHEGIKNIYATTKVEKEKISEFCLEKREFEIESNSNYLIRVGLGGPEGSHKNKSHQSHFAIFDQKMKKAILFTIC
jgi:hypothetical protein